MEADEYQLMADVEDAHWWWRARREILRDTLERYLEPNPSRTRRVLEVGCGTGGNLSMLQQFGDVAGAESSPLAVAFVRAKQGARFAITQHAIPQPLPGPFDLVALFDVIEHIEDDKGALRWVADHLEPGGLAIITAPACPVLWTEHDEAAHHFRRYTHEAMRKIVGPEFEILHLTSFNTLLFPLVALVRLGTKLLPKRWRPQGTNMGLPPAWLNSLLYRVFGVERRFVPHRRSPIGVSVLAVLRRRAD